MDRHWWGSSRQWGPWAAAFAAGRRGRFFESGEVRLALLSLLSEGPKHGYQLMKEIEERSGGLYRASAGSVYPTLQQLEDEELIASDQSGGKRVYRITAAGKKELARDPDAVRRIWRRAEDWEDWGQCMGPQVIALAGPVAVLMKSTFRALNRGSGKPEREEQIRKVLDWAVRKMDNLAESWKE